MENDALAAGVSRIGGLFSTADIRILICYIISSIGEPVPGRLLADILHYEGIANCFEVNDSIAALLKNGFFMMQESVYSKLALNQNVANGICDSIKKHKPSAGLVQMLTVTEKQYSKMEMVVGSNDSNVVANDERLLIL